MESGVYQRPSYESSLLKICRWTHGTLQQGEVEEIIKRRVKKISSVTVEYDTSLCALDFETQQLSSPDAYPCLVSLQSTRGGVTQVERVRSKYVIGADGGKSTTRALLGFDMLGEQGSSIWGVMDFKGASDFPEYVTCFILSGRKLTTMFTLVLVRLLSSEVI